MASTKSLQTVAIVNPKDPQDPQPWTANISDVALKGFTLWADRHDPKLAADAAQAAAVAVVEPAPVVEPVVAPAPVVEPVAEKPVEAKVDDKPVDDKPEVKDGSAVDPKDVKKAPGK